MPPAEPGQPARLQGVRLVSLDFGNTLVRLDRDVSQAINARVAEEVAATWGLADASVFREAWAEERDRQFREDVPAGREVDLEQRTIRVLARLRGMARPGHDERWDDERAAGFARPAEVDEAIAVYTRVFVEGAPVLPDAEPCLRRLAADGFRLVILSNWPLATAIDRYVEAAGWAGLLDGVFVSQRIGAIKPQAAIFRHVEAAIGEAGPAILHVGDDWAADVVGAVRAGWRAAYLRERQGDTPLPTSVRDGEVAADLELDHLGELPGHLAPPTRVTRRAWS